MHIMSIIISFFSDLIHNFVSSHCILFYSLIVFSSFSLFFSLQVDKLVLGGGMVFTFLKARGVNVGNSLVEDDQVWKSVVCPCILLYLFFLTCLRENVTFFSIFSL